MDRSITFMHISRLILVSKSTSLSFTFFHMNIRLQHHIFRRRFVYIHTFFHRKIMRGCRLRTCLYSIRRASCERKFHHSHVAPPVPIWAEFYIHHRQDMLISNSSRHEPPKPPCRFAPRDHNIYAHICRGKWRRCNPYAHMRKSGSIFFAQSHYMYCILLGKM